MSVRHNFLYYFKLAFSVGLLKTLKERSYIDIGHSPQHFIVLL
jgi:hypothetical protein